MSGRRCEIDVINGAIPREGRRAGVATPVNDLVCALIRAKELAFR
jgi:2-dehydropantoate 2-reductase